MRRKLSDKFVDDQIAKIDAIYKKIWENTLIEPDCLVNAGGPYSKLCIGNKKEIKEYYKQLKDLSYVQGFWMGWSLREGLKQND